MQKVFCLWWASNGPLDHFFVIQNICINYNPAGIWQAEKKNSFSGVFQRFCSWIQNSFLKCKFLCRYFSRILLPWKWIWMVFENFIYSQTSIRWPLLGPLKKWSPWTGSCLIKHLYKTTTYKIWPFLAGF